MSHYRSDYRTLVREALTAHPRFAGFTVMRVWPGSIDAATLPVIGVLTPQERNAPDTQTTTTRGTLLQVALRRIGHDEVEDNLDADSEVVEAVVIAALRNRERNCVLEETSVVSNSDAHAFVGRDEDQPVRSRGRHARIAQRDGRGLRTGDPVSCPDLRVAHDQGKRAAHGDRRVDCCGARRRPGAKQKMSELQTVLKSLREEAAKLKTTLWMSETDATIWDNLDKAKVSAGSASGKEIANLTRQIEGMKQLKDATEEWRDMVKSAFTDFVAKGASFRDSLSNIISKLAEMVASVGFDSIWKGLGGDAMSGSFLSWIGIGANANGTPNWRGGMTRVNERGGEILNLPKGTQIIPNDISKRMADQAANSGGGGHVSIGLDQSTGSLTATMVISASAPMPRCGSFKSSTA
ncbi:hypothetical protein [Paracoccus cavernae]|uniref:hypothetical protein n=1 Tax=Paracoccus cavernae TaxID=1571207 RepID=UPI0035F31E2F